MLPPFDGFVGGNYSGTPPANTQNYPYARLLNDQGGQFSQLNWYDRDGRLIISQNTKQQSYKRAAYSYTLFDALGRVIEVGQKTENTDTANNFNKIFGDTILGFYNPNIVNPNRYLAWVRDNAGPRSEVTHTYWDVQDILPTKILVQQEIRNRVTSTTFSDTLRSDSTKFNNAAYYSYDVHGNVSTLIQDDSVQGVAGQRYKRMDYQYDLVSGNVNEFDYQTNQADQYHHKYMYDADNRITSVYTSKDSVMWDNDANYFFYAHDKLARAEIGDQQVQGMDYAYTLQGRPKGLNSDQLDGTHDIGQDAQQVAGNLNRYFARDVAGYTIDYFTGDYDPIDKLNYWNSVNSRFEANGYHSDLMNSRHDLFEGNVSAVTTTITEPQKYLQNILNQTPTTLPQGSSYNYDQLNRIIDMKAFQNLDATSNAWLLSGTYNGLYHNWFTYDANGNILTQKRADSVGEVFDSLTYQYNIQGGRTLQNRLYHVNDAVNVTGINYDIKDEGTFNPTESTINHSNNYRYSAIGELAKDIKGSLDTIIWKVNGKPWKIKKHNGDSIIFSYDVKGNRITEEYKPFIGDPVINYYVHDVQGHLLTIYVEKGNSNTHTLSLALSERYIYGISRLGSDATPVEMIGAISPLLVDTINRYLGLKHYEIDNYLANVLVLYIVPPKFRTGC